ncbi:hypothetical protein RclHR1_01820016 [Rhizophagus clarus]|uniref:Protein kinase domain-containing protein n=1 Tax=Rhizophagus clarus TaxID=94130 RepID=A0A2Z6QLT5_9GLOM|nr:hypothetical protein RclHR1_01820016 [Rhizophagus clarus]
MEYYHLNSRDIMFGIKRYLCSLHFIGILHHNVKAENVIRGIGDLSTEVAVPKEIIRWMAPENLQLIILKVRKQVLIWKIVSKWTKIIIYFFDDDDDDELLSFNKVIVWNKIIAWECFNAHVDI